MKRVLYVVAIILGLSLTSALARDSSADYLWCEGGSTTVTPGTPFTVNYYTQGDARAIHLRIYRIGVDQAIALVRAHGQMQPVPSGALVWEGNASAPRDAWSREVSVGPFPIGLYAVHATLGTASSTVLANVTTLGVLHVQSEGALAAWAIDLRTFRRHQGLTAIRLAGKSAEPERAADVDGVALFSQTPSADGVVIARTADGSADVSASYWYQNGRANLVQYVQTDRPVYRPGQTVSFRAIVRSGYEERYRIPSGLHRVEVDDAGGTKMYSRRMALSPFGTLNGIVALPQAAQLGAYQISIDGQSAKAFSVQAYKKPEYVLDARAANDEIVSGDDAYVTVEANYVFGRPAAGMRVHYTSSGWYWRPYYDPFAGSSSYPGSDSLPTLAGDAVTDSQGRLRVRIPTNHSSQPYTISVDVSARDNSGRTVSTQSGITAYPADVTWRSRRTCGSRTAATTSR